MKRALASVLTVIAGLLGIGLAVTVVADAAPIQEFPLSGTGVKPSQITLGADGNLWFTVPGTSFTGAVGRIMPSGLSTTFQLGFNNSPQGITAGPDGNVWFGQHSTGTYGQPAVSSITPSGTITTHDVSDGGAGPFGLVTGPDGNLWFTDPYENTVGRSTTTGTMTFYPIPAPNSGANGITRGPDGNLWFTETAGERIGRITPAGVITEFVIPTPGAEPVSIATGPDGNLWFTEAGVDDIGRVTPTGVITQFPVPNIAGFIAAGPDGGMWFTEPTANQIGRITTAGAVTEYPVPTAGATPEGIAAGPGSTLWFAESDASAIGEVTLSAPTITSTPSESFAAGQPGSFTVTTNGFAPPALTDGSAALPAGLTFTDNGDGTATLAGTPSQGSAGNYDIPVKASNGVAPDATQDLHLTVTGSTSATGGPSIATARTSGTTAAVTVTCHSTSTCSGVLVTAAGVRVQGRSIVGVSTRVKARTVTKLIGSARFSVPSGQTNTVHLRLNKTGKLLMGRFYRVQATIAVYGSSNISKRVTFAYGLVRSAITEDSQWNCAGSHCVTTVKQMTVTGLPKHSTIAILCRGGGCPFGRRVIKPKGARAVLAPLFSGHRLGPGSAVTIDTTATGRVGLAEIFTAHPRDDLSVRVLCLPPGYRKPARCAKA